MDVKVPAPVRKDTAMIEFVDKLRIRYLVVVVPMRIVVEVAGSEAILSYIALKVDG